MHITENNRIAFEDDYAAKWKRLCRKEGHAPSLPRVSGESNAIRGVRPKTEALTAKLISLLANTQPIMLILLMQRLKLAGILWRISKAA